MCQNGEKGKTRLVQIVLYSLLDVLLFIGLAYPSLLLAFFLTTAFLSFLDIEINKIDLLNPLNAACFFFFKYHLFVIFGYQN